MPETNYGIREEGASKFVIVAPHAAGDDLRTKELAEQIAGHLKAYLVVNGKYIKPSNSRASVHPHVEDFNKLLWSDSQQKYIWRKKNRGSGEWEDARHPHMKEFYEHIREFAEKARTAGEGCAIVIYIHGMEDNSQGVGVDIGFGAGYRQAPAGTRKAGVRHPATGQNTGVARAKQEDIEKLKATLEQRLRQDHSLNIGIGELNAARSRQDGIQCHAGTPDQSFQLEISYFLRKPHHIGYTAKLIADALKEVYKPY